MLDGIRSGCRKRRTEALRPLDSLVGLRIKDAYFASRPLMDKEINASGVVHQDVGQRSALALGPLAGLIGRPDPSLGLLNNAKSSMVVLM